MPIDPNINRIKFLRTKTADLKPTPDLLDEGELAINLTDRTIFSKNGANVVELGFGKGGNVAGPIVATGNITSPSFVGALNGNANTATKLATSRVISIVGSGTGSANFDGSANATIVLSVNKVDPQQRILNVSSNAKDLPVGLKIDFVDDVSGFPSWGTVITARGLSTVGAAGGTLQLYTPYGVANGGNSLKYRTAQYIFSGGETTNPWSDFKTILDNENFNVYSPTLVGVGASGSWNINSATATKLQTARTINDVSFDGSSNINIQQKSIIIPSNADLNNYKSEGFYYLATNAVAVTILNLPRPLAFTLMVERTAGCVQTLKYYNTSEVWTRSEYQSVWTNWVKIAGPGTIVTNASQLETPRLINGTPFNGTGNITISDPTITGDLASLIVDDLNNLGQNAFDVRFATVAGSTNKPIADDVSVTTLRQNANHAFQTATNNSNGTTYTRGKSANVWGAWNTTLHSNNFGTYAVPISGGTMTGTLTTTRLSTANISNNQTIKFFGPSDAAGKICVGGLLVSSAYSDESLVPPQGAYIKGNFVTSGDIIANAGRLTIAGVKSPDKRVLKPSELPMQSMQSYFTSIEGMNTGTTGTTWADLLVLNTYTDGSASKLNALALKKFGQEIYHYKATFGAETWDANPLQLAYTTSNVASATKLQTARLIGGVSFDGTTNIVLPGVNAAGTQNTTGSSARVASLGVLTAPVGAENIVEKGMTIGQGYNSGYPVNYGNVIRISNSGSNEIYCGWSGADGGDAPMYFRNKRDLSTAPWSNWRQFMFVDMMQTYNAGTATKLQTPRTFTYTGDATGSLSFDGSANVATALTLSNTGVAAGTYKSLTVDVKGRVTGGNNVVTSLISASTAAGTSNEVTNNANTYLNIVENVGGALSSVGSSTQIVGAGNVTVTSDANGKLTITGSQNTTGNAESATKLQTPRKINGVDFDGTQDVQIDAIRIGTISWHLGNRSSIFTGDLSLDGQLLNRVDYPELWSMVNGGRFSVIADVDWLADPSKRGMYSLGNGITTFRLPDLNGVQTDSTTELFLRGSKTTPAGSVVGDAIRNITGVMGNIRYDNLGYSSVSGVFEYVSPINNTLSYTGSSNTTGTAFKFDASKVVPTADENRPKSVYGVWVVSAKGSNVVVPESSTAATLTGGNTFNGSQTFNGDVVVKQDLNVEGAIVNDTVITSDIGQRLKAKWVGAYTAAQTIITLTRDAFDVYNFSMNMPSSNKYLDVGNIIHVQIGNTAILRNAKILSVSQSSPNSQTMVGTVQIPGDIIVNGGHNVWAITYEAFGCEYDGLYSTNGDLRWVNKLKYSSPLTTNYPVINCSGVGDSWWGPNDTMNGEFIPKASFGSAFIVSPKGKTGMTFSVGDNSSDIAIRCEYLSITVYDNQ